MDIRFKMNRDSVDPLNVTYVFDVEKTYNEDRFASYMDEHWTDSCLYSAIYLLVIFAGHAYMRKQKDKYELRPYLVAWSSLLAVFSIVATLRVLPLFVSDIRQRGVEYTCCDSSYLNTGAVSSFWAMLFILSKVVELGDTAFIVLRKQPLIFLHWYHHASVLIYSWYLYPHRVGTGRWFMTMNYLVHSFMYTYYALRAMKFRLPRWVSIFITALQLSQMVMGVTSIVVSYMALNAGRSCKQNYTHVTFSLLMYLSYLILFAQFFHSAYIAKQVPQEKKSN